MSNHIMIDIETLSTRGNAAIVSIGACVFRLNEEHGDGYAGDESFIVGIDPEWYDCHPFFHVDDSTVRWWDKQSKEAHDSLKINQQKTLPLALDLMNQWFEDVGFIKNMRPWRDDSPRVWANPCQFDLVILRNGAAHAYGSANDVPWHYRQETCCRTLSYLYNNLADKAKTYPLDEGLVAHRADHDAIRQARFVQFIMRNRND